MKQAITEVSTINDRFATFILTNQLINNNRSKIITSKWIYNNVRNIFFFFVFVVRKMSFNYSNTIRPPRTFLFIYLLSFVFPLHFRYERVAVFGIRSVNRQHCLGRRRQMGMGQVQRTTESRLENRVRFRRGDPSSETAVARPGQPKTQSVVPTGRESATGRQTLQVKNKTQIRINITTPWPPHNYPTRRIVHERTMVFDLRVRHRFSVSLYIAVSSRPRIISPTTLTPGNFL